MSGKNIAVVIFIDDDSGAEEVGLIPTSWLVDQEKKFWWPPFKNAPKVTKSIQEMWKPDEASWSLHCIRVLGKCRKCLIILAMLVCTTRNYILVYHLIITLCFSIFHVYGIYIMTYIYW